ncbi:MAG: hypothetical protein OEX77_00055 [Candidatus Bathyarchaeota archaeon]|nr:hypothetical protein [Candidatus Bathyarchaeota archaeon]MDH5732204.1 hypothetical protein [Candidatus Bathyarchaeota archaeon]
MTYVIIYLLDRFPRLLRRHAGTMLKNEETEKPRYVAAVGLLIFYGLLAFSMIYVVLRISGIS